MSECTQSCFLLLIVLQKEKGGFWLSGMCSFVGVWFLDLVGIDYVWLKFNCFLDLGFGWSSGFAF